jgi:predicted nucleic acid-binding protein
MRTKQIDIHQRSMALEAFRRLIIESFIVLPVSDGCFRLAVSFADRHLSGIRAGDALHLAVCAEHGVTLCTLDQRLAEAGQDVGVNATLL